VRVRKMSGAFLAGLLATAGATMAVDHPNQIEGNVGWYQPSDLELELHVGPAVRTENVNYQSTLTWGARYGYRFSDMWGVGASWTHVDMDAASSDANRIQCSTCQFNADFYDFDGEWYIGGGDWSLYAGVGWLTTNFKISIQGDSNDRAFSDDTFTWNVGGAYTWRIGSNFYLRPDLRVRFLQLDKKGRGKYDSEDPEFKLGAGWMF